jgi:hypothetical protein
MPELLNNADIAAFLDIKEKRVLLDTRDGYADELAYAKEHRDELREMLDLPDKIIKIYGDESVEEIPEVSDKQIEDYVNSVFQDKVSDFWAEVRRLDRILRCPFVVTGYDGTWRGPREIVPEVFETLEDALQACFPPRGSHDSRVVFCPKTEQESECFQVTVSHHDGRNHYVIRQQINQKEEE